jgi:hypothetical protein
LMVGTFGLSAQSTSRALDNAHRLRGAVSFDRTTYFPGETAFLTITAQNPTGAPLEVAPPFFTSTGCLEFTKISGGRFPSGFAQSLCLFHTAEPAGSAVFAPGEQQRAVLSSHKLTSDGQGIFRLDYRYLQTGGAFRVVIPRLEAAAVARIRDISYQDPDTGRPVRIPAYMHVFALRWNGQTSICVSKEPVARDKAMSADSDGSFHGGDVPYVRIATSSTPVRSIAAKLDAHDRLLIDWTDGNGAHQTAALNGPPADPVAGGIEVALNSSFGAVPASGSHQFAATVTGSPKTAVKWSVDLGPDAPVGANAGTINAAGLYMAPGSIASPYSVVVTAQSQADWSKSAIALVVLLGGQDNLRTSTAAPIAPTLAQYGDTR